jgi:hypothetical protein
MRTNPTATRVLLLSTAIAIVGCTGQSPVTRPDAGETVTLRVATVGEVENNDLAYAPVAFV